MTTKEAHVHVKPQQDEDILTQKQILQNMLEIINNPQSPKWAVDAAFERIRSIRSKSSSRA